MSARGVELIVTGGAPAQTTPNNCVQLAVTAASANVQLPSSDGDTLYIVNDGPNTAYVMLAYGTTAAVATLSNGFPILSGHGAQFEMPAPINRANPSQNQPALFLAAICKATQTAALSAFVGSGNFNCM